MQYLTCFLIPSCDLVITDYNIRNKLIYIFLLVLPKFLNLQKALPTSVDPGLFIFSSCCCIFEMK